MHGDYRALAEACTLLSAILVLTVNMAPAIMDASVLPSCVKACQRVSLPVRATPFSTLSPSARTSRKKAMVRPSDCISPGCPAESVCLCASKWTVILCVRQTRCSEWLRIKSTGWRQRNSLAFWGLVQDAPLTVLWSHDFTLLPNPCCHAFENNSGFRQLCQCIYWWLLIPVHTKSPRAQRPVPVQLT